MLGGLSEADMQDVDLVLDSLGKKVEAGNFRSVVTANALRFAVPADRSVEHTRLAPAGEADRQLIFNPAFSSRRCLTSSASLTSLPPYLAF